MNDISMDSIDALLKTHGPVPMQEIRANYLAHQDEYKRRHAFTDEIAWGVPDWPTILAIRDFVGIQTLLEVAAGTGLWANMLAKAGVNIIATDDYSWDKDINPPTFTFGKYHFVRKLNALDAICKYSTNALLLVWPPYKDTVAYDALKLFEGNQFIYCGETDGGCNATDEFFDLLEREWSIVDTAYNPQWEGLHDITVMYERLNESKTYT